MQSQIQNNIQTNPEGVRSALNEGMSALAKIETRINADGGNMRRSGFNFDTSHKAYTDFASGKGSVEATAAAVAGDIRNAVGSGKLTTPELVRLGRILTHIVGDADTEGAYLRPAIAGLGAGKPRGGPGAAKAGVTPGSAIKPMDGGEAAKARAEGYIDSRMEDGG